MLLIPAFFGLFLMMFHVYLATQKEPEEDEGNSWLQIYLSVLDTSANYPFLILLAFWSTIYIESWKRKQNTVSYIWGLQERRHEIETD